MCTFNHTDSISSLSLPPFLPSPLLIPYFPSPHLSLSLSLLFPLLLSSSLLPFPFSPLSHPLSVFHFPHRDLESALEMGMDWSLREGYAWAEDKEHCEEYGRMLQADPSKVSQRAKKRGLPQVCLRMIKRYQVIIWS